MAGGKHILGNQPSRHVFGTVRVGEKGQIVIPKEARELFKIGAGDTLLILGDERLGIIVSRPEVVSGAALSVFRGLDGEEEKRIQKTETSEEKSVVLQEKDSP